MKVLLLIGALVAFSACTSQDKSEDRKKELKKIIEKADNTANSYYEDRIGQECDLILYESSQALKKVFYTTVVDQRDGSLNLRLHSIDSNNSERISSFIKVEENEIGFLYIKLNNEGDEIYTASNLLTGSENLTYLELKLDNKINEVKASKKVTIFPTEELPEMSEKITEWFSLTNCEESTKKAIKGL